MTKTLEFSGYSDDTFGEFHSGIDHDDCANGSLRIFRVTFGRSGLLVTGQYGVLPDGVWMVGIGQLAEGVAIPDWPMRWTNEPYSPVLSIEVPEDAVVELVQPAKDPQ